jgi:hypothetical protein
MKILLDFNAKVDMENLFKPTNWNDSLHKINNDSGVRVANFAISKFLVRSTMFPHRNIHKFTWQSPDQIAHILIDRRCHSSILDI